ncbi:hypothetical protein CFP56_006632 [Quercus suber]|uniref:Uncharacterized protein n=1 Tax=Quercus suber TaxID=58331 RepID=A0AAW0LAT8_QUESU
MLLRMNLERFISHFFFCWVKWKDIAGDSDEEFGGHIGNRYNRIALIVGYGPGLKVDAVLLRQLVRVTTLALKNESLQLVLDKFVKHIRDYTATILASLDPAGIIMFGEGPVDLKPFIDVLGSGWLPLVCERFILFPVTWGRATCGVHALINDNSCIANYAMPRKIVIVGVVRGHFLISIQMWD